MLAREPPSLFWSADVIFPEWLKCFCTQTSREGCHNNLYYSCLLLSFDFFRAKLRFTFLTYPCILKSWFIISENTIKKYRQNYLIKYCHFIFNDHEPNFDYNKLTNISNLFINYAWANILCPSHISELPVL